MGSKGLVIAAMAWRRSRTAHENAGFLSLSLLTAAVHNGSAAADPSGDIGWPRVIKQDGKQLTIYQPQVDHWHGHTNLHFRCAIAVKGVLKDEKFGVVEVDALTVADLGNLKNAVGSEKCGGVKH